MPHMTNPPDNIHISESLSSYCSIYAIDIDFFTERFLRGDYGNITAEESLCNDDAMARGDGLVFANYPLDSWVIEFTHDVADNLIEADLLKETTSVGALS